jgi:hypothetical protein
MRSLKETLGVGKGPEEAYTAIGITVELTENELQAPMR